MIHSLICLASNLKKSKRDEVAKIIENLINDILDDQEANDISIITKLVGLRDDSSTATPMGGFSVAPFFTNPQTGDI